jgi:hypothetical protein
VARREAGGDHGVLALTVTAHVRRTVRKRWVEIASGSATGHANFASCRGRRWASSSGKVGRGHVEDTGRPGARICCFPPLQKNKDSTFKINSCADKEREQTRVHLGLRRRLRFFFVLFFFKPPDDGELSTLSEFRA